MKASFVIATYNRAGDLEKCIDSVLTQRNCDYEIIVVDDASPDNTCELVRSKYGDRVQLISRDVNSGSIKNRNHGSSFATGDVLFLIDDDTEFPGPETAAEVMREFEDPRIGAVAIPYLQDGELKHAPSDAAGEERYLVASYIGCASAIRKQTFLELGGYEEFFHHQVEEDDFSIRMLNAGLFCTIARVTQPMMHYESPVRNFQKWDYHGRRNSLLYIWKNCPAGYLLPNLAITTMRGLQHAFRIGRFRGNLSGLAAGYAGILVSIFGKGCRRRPVRKAVYDISRKLRKQALPMAEVEAAV